MSDQLGKWVVGPMLGEGGFSQVRLGTHERDGRKVALKILEKKPGNSVNSTERKQVESEIDAMKKITHKNVIQLVDFTLDMVYKKKNIILVVLELAPGGELFEYLSFTGAFEEPLARSYFHQLVEGLNAAHEVSICHRDLKPENLLMDADFQLKIADFGFAHVMKGQGKLYTECGTTGYMAPEMISQKGEGYDGSKVDVWAIGVILFILIAGFPPYQRPSKTDWWFHKLCAKKFDRFWMAHTRTAYFSDDCKDLINKIFAVDPKQRISLPDIMKHQWYQGTTLDADALKKTLSKRKEVVDSENRKIKMEAQQEQNSVGFGEGTCRAIGDEEGTVEDAESDVLPESGPASIILAQDEVEHEEEENNGDEVDLGEGMGDMSMGMGEDENKAEALEYDPLKVVFTKFDCKGTADDVNDGLLDCWDKLGINYETSENFLHTCNVDMFGGKIHFVAQIFKRKGNENISVVEVQRRGNAKRSEFNQLYGGIRNEMNNYALKQKKDVNEDTVKEDIVNEDTVKEDIVKDTEEPKEPVVQDS